MYDWSWNALSKQDVDGNSLVSLRFKPVDYRVMLLSSQEQNVRYAIDAYRNQKVSPDNFSIDLLKCLFSNHEWSESRSQMSKFLIAGDDESPEWKKQIKITLPTTLSRTLTDFAYNTITSRTDFTMENLGLKWVMDRRQKSGSQYSAIRHMFQTQFPNHGLLLLDGVKEDELSETPENNRKGIECILGILENDLLHNPSNGKFWKTFILSRLERLADYNGQVFEFSAACTVDPSIFSFEWFNKQLLDDG